MPPQKCDLVRTALAAGRRSAKMTSHLFTCSGCRAYRQSLLRIDGVARSLPYPIPPVFDGARLPIGLPTAGTRAPVDHRKFVIGAVVVMAALALGSVVGPRFATPKTFAAEVRSAIARANTWHFSGWKLVDKKRMKWEIWGRRTPFFYREQIGDSLLIATDQTRFRLVAPGDHRPQGLAVTTPAAKRDPRKSMSGGPESFIEGLGGEFIGGLTRFAQDAETTTLRTRNDTTSGSAQIDDSGLLVVDRRSNLPVRYTLARAVHAEESASQMATGRQTRLPITKNVILGQLEASYNVPIPNTDPEAPIPAGYAAIDLRQTAVGSDPSVPRAGTASASGITVHANVVSQDAEGNLHVKFDGWFGRQKITPELPCYLFLTPVGDMAMPIHSNFSRLQEPIRDNRGVDYIMVFNPYGAINPPEWYLAPVEPVLPGQKRPVSLAMWFSLNATWYEYIPDAQTGVLHDVASDTMEMTTPLPKMLAASNYDTRSVPFGIALDGSRAPLRLAVAIGRADYYLKPVRTTGDSHHNLVEQYSKRHFERAIYWADQARRMSRTLAGGQPQDLRFILTRIHQGFAERRQQTLQHTD